MAMRRPSRRTWRLLALAAEQRANAASWAAIARLVGRREQTCRRWPWKYSELWGFLYALAEARVIRTAVAEARLVLAQLKREKTERTARSLAGEIRRRFSR
jgi:hypothetical protein